MAGIMDGHSQQKGLDEQLRLLYQQVTKNSPMGLHECIFVANSFGADAAVIRKMVDQEFNNMFALSNVRGIKATLKLDEFIRIMRSALGHQGGSDPSDITNKARTLARTYAIMNAPIKPTEHEKGLPSARRIDRCELWEPLWDKGVNKKGNNADPVSPPGRSRFIAGSITARRGEDDSNSKIEPTSPASMQRPSTAAFMAPQMNLTLAARRAQGVTAPGGITKDWSQRNPQSEQFFIHSGNSQPEGIDKIVEQIRSKFIVDGLTPIDALVPFRHYDKGDVGYIPIPSARICFLELGVRVSSELITTLVRKAGASTGGERPKTGSIELAPGMEQSSPTGRVSSQSKKTNSPLRRLLAERMNHARDVPEGCVDYISLVEYLFANTKSKYDAGSGTPREMPSDSDQMLQYFKSKILSCGHKISDLVHRFNSLDADGTGLCKREGFADIVKFFTTPVQTMRSVEHSRSNFVDKDYLNKLITMFQDPKSSEMVDFATFLSKLDLPESLFQTKGLPVFMARNKSKRDVVVDNLKPANRSQKRVALLMELRDNLFAKTPSLSARQLRQAFEYADKASDGLVSITDLVSILNVYGVGLSSECSAMIKETFGSPYANDMVEYGMFIAVIFAASHPESSPVESSKVVSASQVRKSMKGLSIPAMLQTIRKQVEQKMQRGPGELRKCYELFALDSSKALSAQDVQRLFVDFGIFLTPQQSESVLRFIDPNNDGLLDYFTLIRAVLPEDAAINLLDSRGGRDCLSPDFKQMFASKVQRQFVRKGQQQSVPAGERLRAAFDAFNLLDEDSILDSAKLRRALVDLGIVLSESDAERIIRAYQTPSGKVQVTQLLQDVDPKAFEYVFPTRKVGASNMQQIAMEKNIASARSREQEPNESIRNVLRMALQRKIAENGMTNLVKTLREHDTDRCGGLSKQNLRTALTRLGLKVEKGENFDRAWDAFTERESTRPGTSNSRVLSLGRIISTVGHLETVPRPSKYHVRKYNGFFGGEAAGPPRAP